MNKKLKSLNQQLEEMHEEKQAAVKVSDSHQVTQVIDLNFCFFFCFFVKR